MVTKIRSGISKFAHKTGKAPDYVYLGANEWHQLTKEVESLVGGKSIQRDFKENEFEGMEVILVKNDSHLSFGIEANEY